MTRRNDKGRPEGRPLRVVTGRPRGGAASQPPLLDFFDAFSGLSAFWTCSGSSVEWYTGRPHSSFEEIGAWQVLGAALQIDSVR